MYYLLPILIGFFYGLNSKHFKLDSKIKKNIKKFLIYFSGFIFCSGYMTGSDWIYYEVLYNEFNIKNINIFEKDPFFYVLIFLFKNLGFSFFLFLVIMKSLVFFIIVRFLNKYSGEHFVLSFSIFLCTNALFIFIDNPLRYMIALGFVILAFEYLIKTKFLIFILLVVVAFMFHISSLIVIFAYFFKVNKISKFKLYSMYIAITVVLTPATIIKMIEVLPSWTKLLISSYYRRFIEEQSNNYYSIGWFFTHILFLFILFNKDKIIRSSEFGHKIFNMSVFYFFLIAIFSLIPTFFRVPIYFAVFMYLSLAISLYNINKNLLIKSFFVLYLLTANIKNIYSTHVYIPYSNYFVHLFKIDLPYQYRIQYNRNEYFKRTGEMPPEYIPSE